MDLAKVEKSGTGARLAHGAEAVGIVHQQAEVVALLEGHDLAQFALVAAHAEDAFGDHEDGTAGFLGQFGGALQLTLAVFDVVVLEHKTLALVQADAVHDAGVGFGVVDDHVAAIDKGVDGRKDALVAEIEQEGGFLAHEVAELLLQLFVVYRVAAHHAGTHGIGQAILLGGSRIDLAYLGVVGQAEVVVQTPDNALLALEDHAWGDFAFQLGEGEVIVHQPGMLAQRSTVGQEFFKKIHANGF
jgi:hypothetical protein